MLWFLELLYTVDFLWLSDLFLPFLLAIFPFFSELFLDSCITVLGLLKRKRESFIYVVY